MRANTDRWTVQFSARPTRMASSTARPLSTGNVPGRPNETGSMLVFGSPPKRLGAPLNILVTVASSACTSRPMTVSQPGTISGAVPLTMPLRAVRQPRAPPQP